MLLNVKDLQERLKIGRDTAYALMRSNKNGFPSIKLGSRYYVSEEALARWLKFYEGKEFLF